MPEPFEARALLAAISFGFEDWETPMVVHFGHTAALAESTCLAYYDSMMIHPLTKEAPLVRTPEFSHESFSRMMCIAQCWYTIALDIFDDKLSQWQFPVRETDPAVSDAVVMAETDDGETLFALATEENFHPLFMGMVVGLYLLNYVTEDSWNENGKYQYS